MAALVQPLYVDSSAPGVFRERALALKYIEDNYPRFLERQVEIAEIPAPPFDERQRAEYFREAFKKLGLKNVGIDAEGNVLGSYQGATDRILAVSAHLDTVFPPGTDVTVTRDGDKLLGPGIVDNSLGLSNILALAETLIEFEIPTHHSILLVATVGEEGLGDLRGMKYLFREGIYKSRIDAFISIDSGGYGLTNGALGSRRYRITLRGPGGHSWGHFGRVNPAHALGNIISRFTSLAIPADPKTTYNVGRIGGGTSVNAIPFEVWMEVDMRSDSPNALNNLEQIFLAAVQQGIHAENLHRLASDTELTVEIDKIGDRPSGLTPLSDPLAIAAKNATEQLGLKVEWNTSSTDANIPIDMNIPAITINGGGEAGNAHSPAEWFDPTDAHKGIQRVLLTILEYDRLIAANTPRQGRRGT